MSTIKMEKPSVNWKTLNETQINSSQVANITWIYFISIVHNNCVWDSLIHNLDKSPSTVNWTIKVIRYSINSYFQVKMISHVKRNVYFATMTFQLFCLKPKITRRANFKFNSTNLCLPTICERAIQIFYWKQCKVFESYCM